MIAKKVVWSLERLNCEVDVRFLLVVLAPVFDIHMLGCIVNQQKFG